MKNGGKYGVHANFAICLTSLFIGKGSPDLPPPLNPPLEVHCTCMLVRVFSYVC